MLVLAIESRYLECIRIPATFMDAHQSSCSQSEPFALQVLGDEMAPEFPSGCVVVAEPNQLIVHGCYVIAAHNDSYIFRQLNINTETNEWTLVALDKNQPIIAIDGLASIRARVIQRTHGRRSTRKKYV